MLGVYSNEFSKHSGLNITPLSGLYSSAFVVYTYSDDSLAIYTHFCTRIWPCTVPCRCIKWNRSI